jgi:hypothetical protein
MEKLLKDSFSLTELRSEKVSYKKFLVLKKEELKFFIPKMNLSKAVDEFSFLKNAIKAGLINKENEDFYSVTESVLSARGSDPRNKYDVNVFFSRNGDDPLERTTLFDALSTIVNVKNVAKSLGISPKEVDFSIAHKGGDKNQVINFVEVDAKLFGSNEEEIKENLELINSKVA